jgi:hypothetical protein
MKRLAVTASVALAACAFTGPALAAGGASGWSEISMEQAACITAGRRAVTQLGFDPSNDDQTVFGWRDQNLVAIRCIASKTVAVFFAYMGTEPEARDVVERLRPFFEQAAAPPAQPGQPGAGGGKPPSGAPGGK